MRVILDTNVLVSGLMFPKSVPGKAVAAWREGRFDLVLPLAQLEEIGRVLAYPRIRKVLKWNDEAIERFLKQLYLRADVVDTAAADLEVRDPSDLHVLQALAAGAAEVLVTGDEDLLALRGRHAIETPADFAKRL